MVVIDLPAASRVASLQLRAASPLTSTVHAPHAEFRADQSQRIAKHAEQRVVAPRWVDLITLSVHLELHANTP